MPYLVDIAYDLKPRINSYYTVSSLHRQINGNENKSRWIISHDDEVDLFIFSKGLDWKDGNICYGLKLINSVIQEVGINIKRQPLKIAKFIDGNNNNRWHGYPADPKNKKQDIPSINILTKWKELKYIGKSDVRKLKQQVTCDL